MDEHSNTDNQSSPRERKDRDNSHYYESNTVHGGNVQFGDRHYWISPDQHSRRLLAQHRVQESHTYYVPRSSSNQFTGRQAETKLIEQYLSTTASPTLAVKHKTIVLWGMGGSGKTQVCLRYAECFQSSYHGVFWIDASTMANAEAGYIFLAQQAGVGTTWMAGKYWLSDLQGPWLLVLDNADDPLLDLDVLLPNGHQGHILITTRLHDFRSFATAGHIKFNQMEVEEAIDLLLRAAFPENRAEWVDPGRRTTANDIAKELGYLAIALSQAGMTIRRKIYTLEKYLRSYLGKRHRLLNVKSIPTDEINVILTWEIPFRRIEINPAWEYQDAVEIMHVFAFLHFESVSESIFLKLWNRASSGAGQETLGLLRTNSGIPDIPEARFRRALRLLAGYSLIDHDESRGICSLHPVVHEWVQSRIQDDLKMIKWLKRTVRLLACCVESELQDSDLRRRLRLMPHVDCCSELALKRAPTIFHTAQGTIDAELLAQFYEANGAWHKALNLFKVAAVFRRKNLGRWGENYLRIQRSIANCHWNLFEVGSALHIQEEIRRVRMVVRPRLADYRHLIRPEYLSYCVALDDLTQSLWLIGMRDLSRHTGRRAVNALTKQVSPGDARLLNAKFNLGRTLRHLGELIEAHALLSEVARRRKNTFGNDHPLTLMARNELGMSFWARQNQSAIAERLVTNVYNARKSRLGVNHPYTLWSANDLSKIYCTRGRAGDAVDLLTQILPDVRLTLGEEHVGMLMTKSNLARAYGYAERWAEAYDVLLNVVQLVDKTHPDWYSCTYGLVRIKTELGLFTEAEEECQKLLVHTTTDPEQNSRRRLAIELLANVYLRSGNQTALTQLWREHPWMNMANIRRPPHLL